MSPNSPYARKVRMVALEKHIELQLIEDAPSAENTKVPEYNPLGKVPVLIMPDGDTLYDSRVIVEFLDFRSPVHKLLPQDNNTRIAVRKLEALADGICDAAVLVILEQRRPPAMQNSEWIARQMAKVNRGLAALEAEIIGKKWFVSDDFSLADIAVACALGYVELRYADTLNWQTNYPQLAAFYKQVSEKPSFKATLPPG